MFFVRIRLFLVCCEGYIYVIGGDSVGGEFNRRIVERYDIEKDEWIMVSFLFCVWQWSVVVVVYDCIYVMILNFMYCYFLRFDLWVEMAMRQISRFFVLVVVFGDKIFYIGGLYIVTNFGIRFFFGIVDGFLVIVEIYDVNKNEWKMVVNIFVKRYSDFCVRVVVILNFLCVFMREIYLNERVKYVIY